MQTIRLVFVLFFGISLASIAQPDPEMRKKRKEIHQKVHTYVKENIFPIVQAQRLKLDAQLSAAHKARIDELRAEAKPLREQMRATHQTLKKNQENGNEISENQKDNLHETHQKLRKIMLEAWTIADEYDTEIKALKTEIEPQIETWKTDIKSIFEENMTDEMRQKIQEFHQKMEENNENLHPKRHGHRKGHFQRFGLKKMWHPARFILLDPKEKMPDFPPNFEQDESEPQALIFPNPSQNTNTLKFDVQQAGYVQINLINAQGKIVKTILNESKSEGTHSLKTDLQNLKTGVYYYQITTPSGTETKRFVIE